ncbi:hypothetical protein D3C72_1667150 [compost metagenome]
MGVVAAGVHDVDFFVEVGAFGFRGEGQVGDFLDRQRVHVGAQGHGRAGQGAFEHGHYAGAGDAGFDVQAQSLQLFGDQFGGALFGVAEFRVGVDVAAGFQQFRLELLRLFGDLRAGAFQRRGAGVAGEQGQ